MKRQTKPDKPGKPLGIQRFYTHLYLCMRCACFWLLVESLSALSLSNCYRQSCFGKKKKGGLTITFHSLKHKKEKRESSEAARRKGWSFSWTPVRSQHTTTFVFVMEHADEGNCHIIAACNVCVTGHFVKNVKGTIAWERRIHRRGFKSSAHHLMCNLEHTHTHRLWTQDDDWRL